MKRAPIIASSRVEDVVAAALARCHGLCLDDPNDTACVSATIVAALLARPEAVALQTAFADSPTEATLIIAMREAGGDLEGTLLGAAARLAGLQVVR